MIGVSCYLDSGNRSKAALGGGVNFDFRFGARLKIHHQDISGLFRRFGFDERLHRFQVFRRADPAHASFCRDSENVEGLCQEKWLPKTV